MSDGPPIGPGIGRVKIVLAQNPTTYADQGQQRRGGQEIGAPVEPRSLLAGDAPESDRQPIDDSQETHRHG